MRHDRLTPVNRAMPAERSGRRAGQSAAQDIDFSSDFESLPEAARALHWGRALAKQGLVLAALAGLAYALRAHIAALDMAAILSAFGAVTAAQWAGAGLATALSFYALAQYDAVIHRALGTQIPPRAAGIAGAAAIALSQTLGFGLISGALARWRLLPRLSLLTASKITATVAASFLIGWGLVTGPALLFLPSAWAHAATAGLALTLAGGAILTLAAIRPRLKLGPITLPDSRFLLSITALAALDTLAACAALWCLLPAEAGVSFAALFPAFLLALGAGMTSGSPGGVGPFELTLLALLPATGSEPLLAAVLAWRAAYFALPALVGGLMMLRPLRLPAGGLAGGLAPSARAALAPPAPELTPRLAALVERAPRAETGLLRQGEHAVFLAGNARAGWMVGRAGRCLVGLLDPFGAKVETLVPVLLPRFEALAREAGRVPCLYKISARAAALARRSGWRVMPVAREAWLAPERFTLETPERAGLRRKLRKADKAGVIVSCPEDRLPLAQMAGVSGDWVRAHGAERGFSMGRFHPDYVSGQRVYLATHGGRLVAFASFHQGAQEWTLDLMRPAPNAPDGTMQALIYAAIRDAQAYGIARLSLAALPPEAEASRGIAAMVWRRAATRKGAAGLRQFKSGFAPNWETLYIAAKGRTTLSLASADIAATIRRPPPLPR